MASVCSGAFILAAAGVLDGKRAATHWMGCDQLARLFPSVTVDANAIFVVDGNLWTSAGVTTGIDMALAMVEQDHGRALADRVAARLVLYVRRPGFQSQFSDAQVAQSDGSEPLGPAITWARRHLAEADVETLARRAGLSVRTLHRRCLETLNTTPGQAGRQAARRARAHVAVVERAAGEDAGGAVRVRQRRPHAARVRARAGPGPARVPRAARGAVIRRYDLFLRAACCSTAR